MVYKRFNLTNEEASIVEGNNVWMANGAYEKFSS